MFSFNELQLLCNLPYTFFGFSVWNRNNIVFISSQSSCYLTPELASWPWDAQPGFVRAAPVWWTQRWWCWVMPVWAKRAFLLLNPSVSRSAADFLGYHVGIAICWAKGGVTDRHSCGPCQHVGHSTRLLRMLQGMVTVTCILCPFKDIRVESDDKRDWYPTAKAAVWCRGW